MTTPALVPSYSTLRASTPANTPRLLDLPVDPESNAKRFFYVLVALTIATLYFLMLMRFFAPAPGLPGIDENAYLVAGKNLAAHGTPGMTQPNPYSFVGSMWIRTANGWYYPKYPAGVPLLNAIAILMGGSSGKFLAFYVSPLCAAGAILGMFFLGRAVAGSFLGLMGMIILASNPTLSWFANVPGSHAPAVFFSIWGMVFLLAWWKSGKWWVGVLAGLALGYTFTTRYSEGLLILPLLAACIATVRYEKFSWIRAGIHAGIFAAVDAVFIIATVRTSHATAIIHPDAAPSTAMLASGIVLGSLAIAYFIGVLVWGQWRLVLRALVPVAAWFAVVGGLLLFNRMGSGHWTGYDSTNESSGFTYTEFMNKWEFTTQQLYMYGLFLVLPLGLMGMALMFQRSWKLALVMLLWFVPGVILYTAYYWGTQAPGIGFIRFFLTLFAPIIASALWLLASSGTRTDDAAKRRGKIALPIGAGLLTAATAAVGIYVSTPYLEIQHIHNANLEFDARQIAQVIPLRAQKGKPIPLVFADMTSIERTIFPQLIMYMQFVGDCDWYSPNAFYPYGGGAVGMMGLVGGMGNTNNKDNHAVLLDPNQMAFQQSLYSGKKTSDLVGEQNKLMSGALDAGRPVYAVLRANVVKVFKLQFIKDNFEMKRLAVWTEPINPSFEEKKIQSPRNADEGTGLSPQPMQLDWLDSDHQPLEIWQITRKAPSTQPAATQASK
jgi:hypothetical protein